MTVEDLLNIDENHKLEWDYNGAVEPYTQNDWNNTLLTKINQCAAEIHRRSFIGGADTLYIHPNIAPIIGTMEYFKTDTRNMCGRYDVIFTDKVPHNSIVIRRMEGIFSNAVMLIPRCEEKINSDGTQDMTTVTFQAVVTDEAYEKLKDKGNASKRSDYDQDELDRFVAGTGAIITVVGLEDADKIINGKKSYKKI